MKAALILAIQYGLDRTKNDLTILAAQFAEMKELARSEDEADEHEATRSYMVDALDILAREERDFLQGHVQPLRDKERSKKS